MPHYNLKTKYFEPSYLNWPQSPTQDSLMFSDELTEVQKCQSKAVIDATQNFCTVQLATCNTNKACRKLEYKKAPSSVMAIFLKYLFITGFYAFPNDLFDFLYTREGIKS